MQKCPQVFEHEYFFLSEIEDEEIQTFLEEATVMDPRFKLKMENDDAIWERLKTTAVTEVLLTRTEEVFESRYVVQFHCDALWSHNSNSMFILKVPVPEDMQGEIEEDVEEGHVSAV